MPALAIIGCALSLTSCNPTYGSSFDYPSEPPVPPGASIIAKAEASDSDAPMRGREIVVETPTGRRAETITDYREQFPATEGWSDGTPDLDVGGDHLLCLVNHSDDGFDEYVEIYPYNRQFESGGPHRFLVLISRLSVVSG